jgi:hypothetical protein
MSAITRLDEWADAPRAIRIVHDIPGRLRLRLPPGASTAGLQAVIDGLNGAESSVWSPRRKPPDSYDPVLTSAEIARAVAEHADVDPPRPAPMLAPKKAGPRWPRRSSIRSTA